MKLFTYLCACLCACLCAEVVAAEVTGQNGQNGPDCAPTLAPILNNHLQCFDKVDNELTTNNNISICNKERELQVKINSAFNLVALLWATLAVISLVFLCFLIIQMF